MSQTRRRALWAVLLLWLAVLVSLAGEYALARSLEPAPSTTTTTPPSPSWGNAATFVLGSTSSARTDGSTVIIGGQAPAPKRPTTAPRLSQGQTATPTTAPRRKAGSSPVVEAAFLASTDLSFLGLPKYPAACRVRFGRVECRGWRMGPAEAHASTWNAEEPVAVPLASVQAVSVGYGTMCAVTGADAFEGTKAGNDPAEIYCWGEGFDPSEPGMMRNKSYAPSTSPVLLHSTADLDAISVGYRYLCILELDVQLRCWGDVPGHGQHDRGIMLATDRLMKDVRAMKAGPFAYLPTTLAWFRY